MERTHIGFFGKTNSGKSSIVNALLNQQVSIVSDIAGTTTDTVNKLVELRGIGACVLMDTPGFDDVSNLGNARLDATSKSVDKTDIAVMVCAGGDYSAEKEWDNIFKKKNIPVIYILNKIDLLSDVKVEEEKIESLFGDKCIKVSALVLEGIEDLKERLKQSFLAKEKRENRQITEGIVKIKDSVMLVMPQDEEAPKGRLILPQVQTIRELLDKNCVVTSVKPEDMQAALDNMKTPPNVIITDSNVFGEVYEKKPKDSKITSFSILFAAYKGDINYYVDSTSAFESLSDSSHILIAECCSHAPLEEDIGRVKIPALLRKKYGNDIEVDVVSGADFPKDLRKYDLIIQCGGCMFNKSHVISRIERAKEQLVPMTNYGITIAYMKGILDKVEIGLMP